MGLLNVPKLLAGPEDSDYGIEQLDFYRMAINEKMALLDLDDLNV